MGAETQIEDGVTAHAVLDAGQQRGARDQWSDRERLILREMARLVGKSLEPGYVIREALHLLSEMIGLNRGRVLLVDPLSGMLKIRHAYGLTQGEIARGQFAPDEGVTGRAFTSGATLIVQDIDAEPAYLARTVDRARLPQETVSYIAQPFTIDGSVAGVLGVHRLRRRDRALADDVDLLRIVTVWIAQILKINQQVERRTASLESENRALKSALERNVSVHGIVGESRRMTDVLGQVERVSQTDATVLLLGESGTGKELFARALHLASARRDAPFVRVNCGAIPEALFESELFGHEKGAFTGASAMRVGRFEQASGGSIFLDEIGDLPLPMQVKLLRTLQERVIERVGGSREIAVDIRLIAATHQDLQQLVAAGRFRLDLFYRLNVIPLQLPSLRERPEDIPALTRHHLHQINQTYRRDASLTEDAVAALSHHDWPGNVRQLRNVLERLVLLARVPQITGLDVQAALVEESRRSVTSDRTVPTFVERRWPASHAAARSYRAVQPGDRSAIVAAIEAAGGNKSRAAQDMGMTLRQLNYRLSKGEKR